MEVKLSTEEWRAKLGSYGVRGDMQTRPINTMSDGLKSRLIFTLVSLTNPHLLLLAEAINAFTGGLVLVSHDFRLIDQVAKEIWECDGGITLWKGDIKSYKLHLQKKQKKMAKVHKA